VEDVWSDVDFWPGLLTLAPGLVDGVEAVCSGDLPDIKGSGLYLGIWYENGVGEPCDDPLGEIPSLVAKVGGSNLDGFGGVAGAAAAAGV
jgi:hypothetical protein